MGAPIISAPLFGLSFERPQALAALSIVSPALVVNQSSRREKHCNKTRLARANQPTTGERKRESERESCRAKTKMRSRKRKRRRTFGGGRAGCFNWHKKLQLNEAQFYSKSGPRNATKLSRRRSWPVLLLLTLSSLCLTVIVLPTESGPLNCDVVQQNRSQIKIEKATEHEDRPIEAADLEASGATSIAPIGSFGERFAEGSNARRNKRSQIARIRSLGDCCSASGK